MDRRVPAVAPVPERPSLSSLATRALGRLLRPAPSLTRPGAVLTEAERRILEALAKTAIPAGRVVPAGGQASADRVEAYLAASDLATQAGYRAMLRAVDKAARLRHRRAFSLLSDAERLALLEALRRAAYPSRFLVRTLLALVKITHFEEPEVYRRLGAVYTSEVKAEPRPRQVAERIVAATECAGESLECDVVVIGTGAGGAVVAKELAEQGLAVVMLEEGRYFDRSDFNRQITRLHRTLYRDLASTTAVGNATILVPVGRTVGGTTTVNSGTCYRTPERVFKSWRDTLGLVDFSSERMAPYYERVEAVLGVSRAAAEHLGGVARVIARGCEVHGWKHGPLLRNAPGCDGQGVCCYGCPTDAKRSTNVSYVPLALRAGATVIHSARASRILLEGGRAVGVLADVVASDAASSRASTLTVRARRVVLAGGALMTPVFLLQNGLANRSGEVGKNLSIHPSLAIGALFDEPLHGYEGIPQGYGIEQFHDEGLLFEGAFLPLPIAAGAMPMIGRAFTRVFDEFERMALFGVMIEDHSRGRVRVGPGGRPLMTYSVGDEDLRRLRRGAEILSEVYFAAGAREVLPLVAGFDSLQNRDDLRRFKEARLRARDFELSAYHPLGTARMGQDPSRSVVGPTHEAHDVPGLYIVDGASVPSSLAVNPQLTIMAMATRAADGIARGLSA